MQTKYLESNNWPNTDKSKELYYVENLPYVEDIKTKLEELSRSGLSSLVDAFKIVFNQGFFKENKRLSADEWKELLANIVKEINPEIKDYNSDKNVITYKNEEINFNWNVAFFNSIFLNGNLVDIGQNNESIKIEDTKSIVLSVENDFGKTIKEIKVKADKREPKILDFNISKTIRESINEKIKVQWKTENVSYVTLTSISEKLGKTSTVELEPTQKTKYIFTAIGYFGQKITKEFEIDVVKPEIVSFRYKINIEKGIKNIDVFWDTKNTNYVEIVPIIGRVNSSGEISIDIEGKTSFKLIAYGDFSSVERVIEAQPFPIPVIKELMFEYPKLEKSFKTANILNWQELNKNKLNLIHPELQVNVPNLKVNLSEGIPKLDTTISIDLEQQLRNNIIINNISFVDLEKELKNKLKKL